MGFYGFYGFLLRFSYIEVEGNMEPFIFDGRTLDPAGRVSSHGSSGGFCLSLHFHCFDPCEK